MKETEKVSFTPSGYHAYFISHKPTALPVFPHARLLQVGFQDSFSSLRDNTGDEIAAKNPSFCELTALYWLWKNDRQDDWLAINHYRRWFKGLDHPEKLLEPLRSKEADMLVPVFEPYRETVREQYCLESGFAKDLDALRRILQQKYPQDVAAFDAVMEQGGCYQYNMMMTSKPLFDAYCSWLFDLLFALEEVTDIQDYNDYQKRIYGFLAERLLNVFIQARHLKVKEVEVVQSEMPLTEKLRLALRRKKNRYLFARRHP